MEINSTPTKQGEAMQILHGVLSLLKHLSIPAANKLIIGAAGPFEACVKTLEESYDVAQPIQVASIGLIKHLVTSSAPNAASLLAVDSALHNILSLSKRTDDVRLKSESTRVVVQLIRALWTSTDQAHQKVRQQLNSPDVVLALGGMVKSSSKWPILINEGLFSLALLATAHEGASFNLVSCLKHS